MVQSAREALGHTEASLVVLGELHVRLGVAPVEALGEPLEGDLQAVLAVGPLVQPADLVGGLAPQSEAIAHRFHEQLAGPLGIRVDAPAVLVGTGEMKDGQRMAFRCDAL